MLIEVENHIQKKCHINSINKLILFLLFYGLNIGPKRRNIIFELRNFLHGHAFSLGNKTFRKRIWIFSSHNFWVHDFIGRIDDLWTNRAFYVGIFIVAAKAVSNVKFSPLFNITFDINFLVLLPFEMIKWPWIILNYILSIFYLYIPIFLFYFNVFCLRYRR